jgi:hypothetical protein
MFWLYVTVREELLPINYYNLMIESALVMGGVFTFLFSKLDPEMYQILGEIPGTVFTRHFTSLFCEFDDSRLAMAVLDLIFTFGSGFMRGTSVEPMEPISDEYPLCRTE